MKNLSLLVLLASIGTGGLLTGCGQKEYPMPAQKGPETPDTKFMDEAYAKSGGDFGKLTPEEQSRVNTITRGRGADVFKYMSQTKK